MRPIPLHPRVGCALWLVPLDGPLPGDAAALLSADERERAARFRFERDRWRFIAARAVLRELLAAHVGEPAAALRFAYGDQGKPVLVQAPRCGFNLSHSEGWGLVALHPSGDGCDVGVDIERLRPVPDAMSLAAASLHAHDTQALGALAPQVRAHAFLTAWTRGEACLKALGTGFSGPGLPVVGTDAAPRRVRLAAAGQEGRTARIETFDLPEAGAIASLAVLAPGEVRQTEHETAQAA